VEGAPITQSTPAPDDLAGMAAEAEGLAAQGMRPRDAARDVARRRGAAANDVYRALVERSRDATSR
jgi:hypothetical protein